MNQKASAYLTLTKPSILMMNVIVAALGYYLGGKGIVSVPVFLIFLTGTALSCGGACALNNYLERDIDARMKRTKKRPLPSGILAPVDALFFGLTLVLAGTTLLAWQVNLLTGFLSLMTTFLYVLVYTPLKKVTWWNTVVGAIPGAIPPMGGWAAATGSLDAGAWVLFLILFIWQHPHFYAIAWMYREDYARGGFKMLPVVDPSGKSTFRQILVFSVLLLLVAALPTVIGMSGMIYLAGSIGLGIFMLAMGIVLARSGSVLDAKRLLRASIIYLPALLILIVLDKGF